VLATGGAGKVYLYTTNPDTATGDGIAMAWRAGCRVANMEFIQFHPTCLYHPYAKSFLITEAMRGEGGLLKLPPALAPPPAALHAGARRTGRAGAARHRGPRHRLEMKKRGLDYVTWTSATSRPSLPARAFPDHPGALPGTLGIDITKQPIPVVPAAHYTCGGVVTDLRRAHRPARPVRGRRNRLHRAARRQPPGQQFAARMRGAGPRLRADIAARPPASRRRRCRPGMKAGSPTPTRKW
jgi:L-aspartate oxidase